MRMTSVALRIERAVLRGEIDNTVEGRTTGLLWMRGRSRPVRLELDGDCWRDLAGSRLTFTNPEPDEDGMRDLNASQTGVVGDMTVSRKARVPECGMEEMLALQVAGEDIPFVWKNLLYLEWFSQENGRVVIESTEFELQLSESEWSMDQDAEEAQKMANLQAMRDFLEGVIARRPAGSEEIENDEFEWERRLRESDRMTDAYQEVLEKYLDDPNAQQKEAFVMGWDGLLGAMADGSTESKSESFDEEEWSEEDEDELFRAHPLQEEAQEMAVRAFDLIHRDPGMEGFEDSLIVTNSLTEVAGKLAGALNGTYERENGYVLAILKRCLARQNDALSACNRVLETSDDMDECRAIEAFRDEIFGLRAKLTDLRQELKRS